ncbi:TMhelix containing protein [Vibrio phage 1.224.A._10N.261.48.B1]|uniref:TMhelix containing protein n=2 Tax=Mukerjeevirus TaxID=2733146 RepID=A0A2I7REI6_9CAUD|nr:TMhelix containing protein [Vibrio phage 1.169.O._10N.261.52.B1]YP_009817680.1 TMhelix containing protein [Vibrio phage 1.224.A._10N.261.48.B1]AUR92066.1 TMhelix containing protein [Vibrio phage 1.169.O._10N.261.52.B1]AUR96447.1 TMhelix containing protein [Vibrio phage 1.224.A._10N.261.48.B1]
MSKFDTFFMAVVLWTVVAVLGIELIAGMDVISSGFDTLFASFNTDPESVTISVK